MAGATIFLKRFSRRDKMRSANRAGTAAAEDNSGSFAP